MRSDLADTLLAKVLDWKKDQVSKYRPQIDMLSQIKYDEYQQFFPGLRFTESLASWLNQKDPQDREVLFKFILERLVFISTREMNQLVSQAFPDFIRPILYRLAAKKLDCSLYKVNKIENSNEYKGLMRKTLFLGLSDGARTDVLRRFNPFISHEQVLPFYLIPTDKYRDLMDELKNDLLIIDRDMFGSDDNKFMNLVLLDDFTASGTSYFKHDGLGNFKGKVKKILASLIDERKLGSLFNMSEVNIILVIYIATERAISVINSAIESWKSSNSHYDDIRIHFKPVFRLTDKICITQDETELCKILEKYFDGSILTNSYRKGKHANPYLGFDEGGLPLILNHNTPNNSVSILWNEMRSNTTNNNSQIGLFPRVSRHKK